MFVQVEILKLVGYGVYITHFIIFLYMISVFMMLNFIQSSTYSYMILFYTFCYIPSFTGTVLRVY